MVKEIVQAISGTHVITDSGTKVPIGNKSFDVGESVWVDGEYVFGDEPNSQPPMLPEGPGEIGNYLVFYKDGQWLIYNVDNWECKTIDDNLGLSNSTCYGMFYNEKGTKFCLIFSDFVIASSPFTYKEVTQDGGVTEHNIDLSEQIAKGEMLVIVECYYNENDEPVFVMQNLSPAGHKSKRINCNGGILQEEDYSIPYNCYTFVNDSLTNTEAVLANFQNTLISNNISDMLSGYTISQPQFKDIIEPTEEDIQEYWTSQDKTVENGDTITTVTHKISEWKNEWEDEFVKDAENSSCSVTVLGSFKIELPKDVAQFDVDRDFYVSVAPKNGKGTWVTLIDSAYDSTVGVLGFDDGSLDNVNCYRYKEQTGTYTYRMVYVWGYGKNVKIPVNPPKGTWYAQYSSDAAGAAHYKDTQTYLGNTTYSGKTTGIITNDAIWTIYDEVTKKVSFTETSFYRTAKYTYTLTTTTTTKTGDNTSTSTETSDEYVYWTRRGAGISGYNVQKASVMPTNRIYDKTYHNGWTYAFNEAEAKTTISKNNKEYELAVYPVQFFAEAIPEPYPTFKNLFYTANIAGFYQLGKESKGITDRSVSGAVPLLGYYILWNIPYAKLYYILNQSAS